jgi:hypothetical protein
MRPDAPIPGVHSILVEEKVPKRRAKRKPAAPGVLGTLPASRPERLGAPRGKPAPAKKPKAVRPGASSLRPKRDAAPPPRPLGVPRGTELVTTSIRAAGELAQIGFTLGGHALKRAVDRIPRPGSGSSGSSTR